MEHGFAVLDNVVPGVSPGQKGSVRRSCFAAESGVSQVDSQAGDRS